MASDKLFEDYDPEMEDVFGRSDRLVPRRITVTEQQKNDPLRKPKVVLNSILVAEKQPVSAKHIAARMLEEDGKVMDAKVYGFETLDELLQACSDTVIHQRRKDGVHVYMPKANEATQDILEMVQQQSDRREGGRLNTGQRPLIGGGSTRSSHGSSFRTYSGPRVQSAEEASNLIRGNSTHFQERAKLGPSKSAARVHNLADVLRAHRSEIGTAHPAEPGRLIVTLAALDKKFREKYALPVWGKHMSESQLHEQLDVPEFAGILKFWRLRPDGDIYVEEGELREHLPSNEELTVGSTRVPAQNTPRTVSRPVSRGSSFILTGATPLNTSSAFSKTTSPFGNRCEELNDSDDYSSIDSRHSNMLLQEDKSDGFFESGPGFGGSLAPSTPAVQTPRSSANASAYAGLAERFGATVNLETAQSSSSAPVPAPAPSSSLKEKSEKAPQQQQPQQQQLDSSYGFSSDDEISDNDEPPRAGPAPPAPAAPPAAPAASCLVPSQRPVDPSFIASRSIVARNPMKTIADYIKSRGSATYDSLPDDDKTLVNFSASVFKVFTTQPGELLVRLHDAHVDTTRLEFDNKDLRAPVEADLRWMATESAKHLQSRRGQRVMVKPVMFVAPRGFLMMLGPSTEEERLKSESDEKMEHMENVLRTQMAGGPTIDLERRHVRPGQAAVYIYREEHEVRYYRVLILGKAHTEGDVMVLLVDHSDQYCVDVQLAQLFPLPDKTSFKYYPPNCVFATLHGVQGMAEEEQTILWKNVDDEERKRHVLGVFSGDKSMILTIDMIWRNETGQLEWLSQIAKRRGAIMSSGGGGDDAPHLSKNLKTAVSSYGGECVMEFFEYPDEVDHNVPDKEDSLDFNSDLDLGTSPLPTTIGTAPMCSTSVEAATASATAATADVAVASNPFSPTSLDLYTIFDKAAGEKNFALMVTLVQFVRNSIPALDEPAEFQTLLTFMLSVGSQSGIRL